MGFREEALSKGSCIIILSVALSFNKNISGENWPLARNTDRSWWHPHTSLKLFFCGPWLQEIKSSQFLQNDKIHIFWFLTTWTFWAGVSLKPLLFQKQILYKKLFHYSLLNALISYIYIWHLIWNCDIFNIILVVRIYFSPHGTSGRSPVK
jgi:hypothetical protein